MYQCRVSQQTLSCHEQCQGGGFCYRLGKSKWGCNIFRRVRSQSEIILYVIWRIRIFLRIWNPTDLIFFSPSLEVADLMRRVLPEEKFITWFGGFYDERSIRNLEKIPVISDIEDYQIVHLVGLSFSRAWCMKSVAKVLPKGHSLKERLMNNAYRFIEKALPLVFSGNYGGDHWLASFALYSLDPWG
ncbi:MAG: DUF2891 family protein [Bergeyella sp.]|nr:DUF2891 family protein [Bergeyella sp.]